MSKTTLILFNVTAKNCLLHGKTEQIIKHTLEARSESTKVLLITKDIHQAKFRAESDYTIESSKHNLSQEIDELIQGNNLGRTLVLMGFDSFGPLFVSGLSLVDIGYKVTIMRQGLVSPYSSEITQSLIKVLQKTLGRKAIN